MDKYDVPSSGSPYIYLNGGTYMGYVWALKDVIDASYSGDCSDDQRSYTLAYLSGLGFITESNSDDRTSTTTGTRTVVMTRQEYIDSYGQSNGFIIDSASQEVSAGDTTTTSTSSSSLPPIFTTYIKLDRESTLFLSLFALNYSSDLDFSHYQHDQRLTNTITGGRPCILHQNGDKGHDPAMPRLVQDLALDKI